MVIQPWTILVVGGELKLDEETSRGQKRGVTNMRIHPQFDLMTLQNDLAVLEVRSTITRRVTSHLANPIRFIVT